MFDFFWIHCYVFAVLFFGIAVLTAIQFSLAIRQRGYKKLSMATLTLYGLLFLVGIERTLYMLLDPYRYRAIIGPVAEQVLYGFAISLLIGVYILIILLWVKMYNATHYTKTLKYVIRSAWIAIAVVFVVELTYDIITGFYSVGVIRMITLSIYTVVLGLGILVIAILFLIYGRKMYRRSKKLQDTKQSKKSKMKKVDMFAKITSISIIVLIFVLGFFVVLQFIFGENVYVLMVSYTCQRAFEFGFSLLVIIMHWNAFKKKAKNGLSQKSTAKKSFSSKGTDVPTDGTDTKRGTDVPTDGTDTKRGIDVPTDGTDTKRGIDVPTDGTDTKRGTDVPTDGIDIKRGTDVPNDGTDTKRGTDVPTDGTDSNTTIL
jgi:hypothetical protein